jgi:uncharacterized membrane protein YraQ (UPF0718 family)
MLAVFQSSPWMKTLSLIFVSIVLEAFPFMLLGSMISGFIEVFVSKDRLAALLPGRRVLLTMLSAGMGMVFPVCECAIVPVVRRFLRKGVPLSAAVAYLLAGPIFNPVVGASTAVAYSSNQGWQTAAVVAIRLGSGFLIAAGIGLIVGRLFPGGTALAGGVQATSESACALPHPAPDGEGPPGIRLRILAALNHSVDDFLDVAQYLVMGAFIAGLLQTAISRQSFLDLAGLPLLAIPLMMLLAVLLNLCSEADAFIAASFRGALPLSGQMAFMVLGPMLDIKLILMYLSVFRKRAIIALALLVFLAVMALMLLLHALLGPWYGSPAGIAPAL